MEVCRFCDQAQILISVISFTLNIGENGKTPAFVRKCIESVMQAIWGQNKQMV